MSQESKDFFVPSIDAEEDMCYLINTCTEFSAQQEYNFVLSLFWPVRPKIQFESPYLDKKIGGSVIANVN